VRIRKNHKYIQGWVGGGGYSYNVVAPPAARWNKKVAVAENDICPQLKGKVSEPIWSPQS